MNNFHRTALAVVTMVLLTPGVAQAAGAHDHGHGPTASAAIGQPGDPAKVTRTVEVVMNDEMRFVPDAITAKVGETVRFFVRNQGVKRHEMVLGTLADLKAHAEMMNNMSDMKHDEPNMINLRGGQRGGMVWQFTQPGTVHFACTLPGHMDKGMVGKIDVMR